MFRLTFIVFLIANLLACPLRCLSCQTAGAVDDDCGPAACCCCQSVEDAEESSNDEPIQEDDCTCPNCICEGATIQAGPEKPEADSFGALGAWVVPANELLLKEASSLRFVTTLRPHRFSRGRDALVAHEFWLI